MDHFRQGNPNQFLNLNTILLVCLPFLETLQKQKCKAEKEKKLLTRLRFLAKNKFFMQRNFFVEKKDDCTHCTYIVSLYL